MSQPGLEDTTLVIFAGTTGFGKSKILKKFTLDALARKGLPRDLESKESQKSIRYFRFDEELIAESQATDIPSFLENPSYRQKSAAIENTFRRIARSIKSVPPPRYVFLDVHLSFTKRSEFIPPINFSNFDELTTEQSPIRVITLIDDVFHIWQTIRKKEEDGAFSNIKLRLREIISWRSVELLQAETVAKYYTRENRNVVNYEVSVRHPSYVFNNLVFNPKPVCAYLSFPITKIRNRPECVKEINDFRLRMHAFAEKNEMVLFDPVTIDELLLVHSIPDADPPEDMAGNVTIDGAERWPLGFKNLGEEVAFPLEIPKREIKEVRPDIDNNIRARDFKLVDTSLCTAAYRPYYHGRSTGVAAEIEHSVREFKRVFAFDSPEDKKDTGSPFDASVKVYADIKDFYEGTHSFLLQKKKEFSE
jgi:hypothetical protein